MSRSVHTVGAGAVSTRHVLLSPVTADHSPAATAAEGNPTGADTGDKPSAAPLPIMPDREEAA